MEIKTAPDKLQLKLSINKFIKALKSLESLESNIIEIKKLISIEEIKYETKKKAIRESKIKKKEELDNRLSFLKAACECCGGYEEKETKLKIKHEK